VVFSEAVTGFDSASDLIISHQGTANTGVTISGSGSEYLVTLSGLSGAGSFTVAVNTGSDVPDLASSVTSPPVTVGTPFEAWAIAKGLVAGTNGGPFDDPDGDGETNLMAFATNGNPLDGKPGGMSRVGILPDGEESFLTATFPVRDGANFSGLPLSAAVDGITYTLMGSSDLSLFDQDLIELSPGDTSGLHELSSGWSYRTFRMSEAVRTQQAGFIRLEIEILE
ncbi:hypothetical protein N9A94_07410, partial [Akkermansiaceae bacterium]|nr:hypothetical protein [Akkermansiaceae bacterium]